MINIWPKQKLTLKDIFKIKKITIQDIEGLFETIYPNVHCVLMPSARSGILSILQLIKSSRNDHVYVSPYSSHCVLNSISFISTPTPILSNKALVSIANHQWGFITKMPKYKNIIEDSVDSLIPSSSNLFPNDANFEILSLSKIFGTFGGGLIICQSKKHSKALREIRDCRNLLYRGHFINKILSDKFEKSNYAWNCLEPLNGYLPQVLLNNIFVKINDFSAIIKDRKMKINLLKESSFPLAKKLPEGRLISCWPYPIKNKKVFAESSSFQLLHCIEIVNEKKTKLVKVLVIPLHQDINKNKIKKIIKDHVLFKKNQK